MAGASSREGDTVASARFASSSGRPAAHRLRRGNRRRWERLWTLRPWVDAAWEQDQPPEEIVRLVDEGSAPAGAALDIGCGAGPATSYLSRHFRPACGVDIVPAAIGRARQVAASHGTRPVFVVAEAPTLPFRAGSFGLIVDRGCFQSVPRPDWPGYLREAARLLVPGGVLQLSITEPVYQVHALLSPLGWKRAMSRFVRGVGPSRPTLDQLQSMAGADLEAVSSQRRPIRGKLGRPYLMTIVLFRRRPDRPNRAS
jgi:SAM-dependent methyltransferase